MPRPRPKNAKTAKAELTPPSPLAEADAIGRELVQSLARVVDAPGKRPTGPSGLSGALKFSRVLISRIVNSIRCEDPLEALQRLPGPESLRGFVTGMGRIGVAAIRVKEALAAIDRFDTLIRERHGTRGKLNAAICSHAPSMQRRLELESRQRVFGGMRELRGFEAEAWLSTNLVVPDRDDPTRLTILVLQGFVGLRQLRSDRPVTFDFAPVGEPGSPPRTLGDMPVALEDLYANPPARLETISVGGRKVYRLAQDQLGKDVVCDMLSLVRMPRCMPRFANPERRRTGPFALIKAPVKTLHFDILLADGLVDGSEGSRPELFAFSPGPGMGTNVNERIDHPDRVEVPESIEVVPPGSDRFDVPAVPNYRRMLERIARETGHDLDSMRVHRLSVAYPPFGYEFVSTFRLRTGPAGGTRGPRRG